MKGECLALADAGADHEFGEVGVERVRDVGEAQEAGGLLLRPQMPWGGGGAGQDRWLGGLLGQAAVGGGAAEGTGEGGHDPVDGHLAAALSRLFDDEGPKALAGEVEGGDEVLFDVGAVAGHGRGFEVELPLGEPVPQVLGGAVPGVGDDAQGQAPVEAPQCDAGVEFVGEAGAADGAVADGPAPRLVPVGYWRVQTGSVRDSRPWAR
ncbi:hypothetical protein CG736_11415 [Kitasatospora sp. CB02891]|nr:hypothetical protein CG736_11415 [Kitasatospora sp. CB02891]